MGKSTVAFALHDLLSARGVQHAVIEGDALDLAYPAPWEQQMAERNLKAIWNNYAADGYRRLIYTNTVSVLEADKLARAPQPDPRGAAAAGRGVGGEAARLKYRECEVSTAVRSRAGMVTTSLLRLEDRVTHRRRGFRPGPRSEHRCWKPCLQR